MSEPPKRLSSLSRMSAPPVAKFSEPVTLGGAAKMKFAPTQAVERVKGTRMVQPEETPAAVETGIKERPKVQVASSYRVAFQAGANAGSRGVKREEGGGGGSIGGFYGGGVGAGSGKGSGVAGDRMKIKKEARYECGDDVEMMDAPVSRYPPVILQTELTKEEKNVKKESLYLFQLPSHLPYNCPVPPTWSQPPDDRVYVDRLAQEMYATSYADNIKLDGRAGVLKMYKSGKMVWDFGNTSLIVKDGTSCAAQQEVVNIKDNVAVSLGPVVNKMVVSIPVEI